MNQQDKTSLQLAEELKAYAELLIQDPKQGYREIGVYLLGVAEEIQILLEKEGNNGNN